MQVSKAHNFFFHPFDESHSTKVKVLSTITVVALSILTGFVYLAIFAIVNLRDRCIKNVSKDKQDDEQPKKIPENAEQLRDRLDRLKDFLPNNIEKDQIPELVIDQDDGIEEEEKDDLAKPTEAILKNKYGFSRSNKEPGFRQPYGYVGDVQGHHKFREKVAIVTQKDFHALSPQALRENREVNPMTSLTLTAKRVGHALSLNGDIILPNNTVVGLEGFSEVFTIPMVADSFEKFANENRHLVDQEMSQWILEFFAKSTRHDGLTEGEIAEHLKNLNSPIFEGPLCVSTGFDWHGTFLVFYRNLVFYMNRGADPYALKVEGAEEIAELSGAGTSVFQTRKPTFNMSLDTATKMFKRMTTQNANSAKMKNIQDELDLHFVDRKPSKNQAVGNCTYVNTKLALKTLIALYSLKDKENITTPDIDEAFKQAKVIYKEWVKFDRNYVVKDLVEEIKALREDRKQATSTYEILLNLLKKVSRKQEKLKLGVAAEIEQLLV